MVHEKIADLSCIYFLFRTLNGSRDITGIVTTLEIPRYAAAAVANRAGV